MRVGTRISFSFHVVALRYTRIHPCRAVSSLDRSVTVAARCSTVWNIKGTTLG